MNLSSGESFSSPKGQPPSKGVPRIDKGEVFSFLRTLVILVIAAMFLRGSLVEAFKIPSGSMKPTLKEGDHILVSKFSYGFRLPFISKTLYRYGMPQRGDIVVFTRPDDSSTNIIKRVIGLPGDTVEVQGTKVSINGTYYPEEYARWVHGGIFDGNFGPAKVPENKILLLGDNRDESKDSRFWSDPFLDLELVKGRALIVYWSWDSMGRIGTLIR